MMMHCPNCNLKYKTEDHQVRCLWCGWRLPVVDQDTRTTEVLPVEPEKVDDDASEDVGIGETAVELGVAAAESLLDGGDSPSEVDTSAEVTEATDEPADGGDFGGGGASGDF